MTNLQQALKHEISRLARKAARTTQSPAIAKRAAGLRRDVAELKRQSSKMQREIDQLRRIVGSKGAAIEPAKPTKARAWITAKGIASIRARLDLSREQMALLCDCSPQSIYNWEKTTAAPRADAITKLLALRTIGRREALARLAVLGKKK